MKKAFAAKTHELLIILGALSLCLLLTPRSHADGGATLTPGSEITMDVCHTKDCVATFESSPGTSLMVFGSPKPEMRCTYDVHVGEAIWSAQIDCDVLNSALGKK